MHTRALIERLGRIPSRSKSAWKRQKPTRIPYSCQLQLGTSGSWVTPVGGASTCRGMAREMSQTSTFTIVQTMMRSPFGKRSFGRSTIAEYFARSLGNAIAHTTLTGLLRTPDACASCTEMTRRSVPNSLACCQRGFTWRQFEFSTVLCDPLLCFSEFNTEDAEKDHRVH